MAGWTGLEPATSDVTGRRSNQLNYHPARWVRLCASPRQRPGRRIRLENARSERGTSLSAEAPQQETLVGGTGLEPVTPGL